jgi:hypothetical protein
MQIQVMVNLGQGVGTLCWEDPFIVFLFLQISPNNNYALHAEFNPE